MKGLTFKAYIHVHNLTKEVENDFREVKLSVFLAATGFVLHLNSPT
jgi:hypothetical protein